MKAQNEINTRIGGYIEERKNSHMPLKDIRVIDLATVVAAPFAATLLGDFGAEVIKIESPNAPDATRNWGVLENKFQPFWSVFSRNKLPITLNLKSEQGKEIFLKLISQSDVLIENMRPGAMDRLGLDSQTLIGHNPGLVVGKVSGYGQTGPYSSKPGFGTLAEGFSGFSYLNRQPTGIPSSPPMALADLVAGVHLAFGIMILLRNQVRCKKGGTVIDMSLYEPLFGMLGPDFLSYVLSGMVPEPKGNELSYVVPRNNYQTRDGRWMALSGGAQKPFERLMEAVGHPEMNQDPRFKTNDERIKDENRAIINQVIAEWIGSKDHEEVLEECDRLGITIGPINSMADIATDVHYRERESFLDVEDMVTGETLKLPNVPFRIQDQPGKISFPGLPLGSANEVILSDLLNYSPEEIKTLKASGAI
jgi:crotonobetainyl-CoA:carnitine CoA-transferase CaiB-like acyl-CoA transferase